MACVTLYAMSIRRAADVPVRTALAGLTALALGVLTALNARSLPVIGDGTTYAAEFSEAAGLFQGNDVRIAGVEVGRVSDVELRGDRVLVSFRVKGAWLGDATGAAIRLKTVLGQKYLALDPQGEGTLDPGRPIPRSRTTVPYDVLTAFGELSSTVDRIDTSQLAKSFDTLSATLADTPQSVRAALTGLSRLSDTLATRDHQLATLLGNTRVISQTLVNRDAAVQRLLNDGNQLLSEVNDREQAISSLLDGSRRLATELSGLIEDNDTRLDPLLTQLDQLTSMLQRNQDALAAGIRGFAPLVRLGTNISGSGRFIDGYLCGLILPSFGPLNEEGCHG
ncbi:phospholipid/cholesterol/gamma-HCH transport system substrate-binding protein [Amycolatopsis pretoriensis]|uniref:Phospholipid/cholesterol/gamma-HCH transport system substrate-binding protein n=2 Tax=Amycolatopsis pretoriensis TaxID=218821 RepID=A0A1H5QMK5_9PSEU|nr:phospholipid/cholesterol/gamma-HCH transport system substrate-binding protein [Amycolatopsis pretoriensis]